MSFLSVRAQEITFLDGQHPQNQVQLPGIAQKIRPGDIVVIGENHGFAAAQKSQLLILEALRQQGLAVSVGLEFFYYPDQPWVDRFRLGSLTEADFLQKIQWGSPSFDFYRDQALFPRPAAGEVTLALNAPRSLTGRISKVGLEGLTSDEKLLLPPGFQLGRDSYKKRFLSQMPHLPSPEAGERYFAAQSTWDDTMAWRATEFMQTHPDQVLVIVVGDFHAQYFGGLPDRIQARRQRKPWVFSYINAEGLSEDELAHEVDPSTADGPRGDTLLVIRPGVSTL